MITFRFPLAVAVAVAVAGAASASAAPTRVSGSGTGGRADSAAYPGAVGAKGRFAVAALSVRQEPVLGHLIVPADRVEIDYTVQDKVASPAGSLSVRNDLMRGFERLPLRLKGKPLRGGATLWAVVPARLLGGHRLFYFAVVRDARSGRSTRTPVASAWVLQKPVVVRLGVHRFGRVQRPEAVVARATASQVGWDIGQEFDLGPQTFQVGADRSIWLHDSFGGRLLVWRPGTPAAPARSLPLPPGAGIGELAFGPGGSIYVSQPGGPWGVPHLYRLSATGAVLWQSDLPAELGGPPPLGQLPLQIGPGGTLYLLVDWMSFDRPAGEAGWMPVATPRGEPFAVSGQRAGILWGGQPLAGGRRLVAEPYVPPHVEKGPYQWRYAIVDKAGRVVRAWRVLSATDLYGSFFTPQLVGGDPVVDLTFARPGTLEHLVLRLSPAGTSARIPLRSEMYGDTSYSDLRVGPDGKLYQLATSPHTGIAINRYTLGR